MLSEEILPFIRLGCKRSDTLLQVRRQASAWAHGRQQEYHGEISKKIRQLKQPDSDELREISKVASAADYIRGAEATVLCIALAGDLRLQTLQGHNYENEVSVMRS